MNAKLYFRLILVACFGLFISPFALAASRDTGYEAFLQKIAADCKPLVIGNDNFGQAIIFNGQGGESPEYAIFLDKTEALYNGGLSAKQFHDSIAIGAAGGKDSDRAIECIIAHVPES